tara:strand:- start:96 stop:287 length:192 start_codon:yes stop_codon:yes gene_type:complete
MMEIIDAILTIMVLAFVWAMMRAVVGFSFLAAMAFQDNWTPGKVDILLAKIFWIPHVRELPLW